MTGHNYGVLPLGLSEEDSNTFKFLVFGGVRRDEDSTKDCLFITNLDNLTESTYETV